MTLAHLGIFLDQIGIEIGIEIPRERAEFDFLQGTSAPLLLSRHILREAAAVRRIVRIDVVRHWSGWSMSLAALQYRDFRIVQPPAETLLLVGRGRVVLCGVSSSIQMKHHSVILVATFSNRRGARVQILSRLQEERPIDMRMKSSFA